MYIILHYFNTSKNKNFFSVELFSYNQLQPLVRCFYSINNCIYAFYYEDHQLINVTVIFFNILILQNEIHNSVKHFFIPFTHYKLVPTTSIRSNKLIAFE